VTRGSDKAGTVVTLNLVPDNGRGGDGAAGNSRIRKDARIELLGGLCLATRSAGPACGGKVLSHIGT
jgi:hypothetical protein